LSKSLRKSKPLDTEDVWPVGFVLSEEGEHVLGLVLGREKLVGSLDV
jgi:hypothetical protein